MYLSCVILPLKKQLISNQYLTSKPNWTISYSKRHVTITEYISMIMPIANVWCMRRSGNSESIWLNHVRISTEATLNHTNISYLGEDKAFTNDEPSIRPTTNNLVPYDTIKYTWYLAFTQHKKTEAKRCCLGSKEGHSCSWSYLCGEIRRCMMTHKNVISKAWN
jgi:hypothetical protein